MPNDKYEDEIRDILNRMDNFVPDEKQTRRPPPPRQPNSLSVWMAKLTRQASAYDSTSLLIWWIVLALGAGILARIYPPLGAMAALASVACLLGAILLPMISRRYGRPERRWRGRIIDYQPARIRRPLTWRYVWWRIKSFFGFR
jgi:hypothetical protein